MSTRCLGLQQLPGLQDRRARQRREYLERNESGSVVPYLGRAEPIQVCRSTVPGADDSAAWRQSHHHPDRDALQQIRRGSVPASLFVLAGSLHFLVRTRPLLSPCQNVACLIARKHSAALHTEPPASSLFVALTTRARRTGQRSRIRSGPGSQSRLANKHP